MSRAISLTTAPRARRGFTLNHNLVTARLPRRGFTLNHNLTTAILRTTR
jgi:hypothetical protein